MRLRFVLAALAASGLWAAAACGGKTTGTTGSGGSSSSSSGVTTSSGSSSSGATSSSGASSSGASSSSGAGGSASSSSGSSSSGAGGGPCMSDAECNGFSCCGGKCVNEKNDIENCGQCNHPCAGGVSAYCDNGKCGKPPCNGQACPGGGLCCAANCCQIGEICCHVSGPQDIIECTKPVEGTCPKGCQGCVCASPETPIATPSGERPIAELAAGDLVYSVDGRAIVAVPIKRVAKVAAHDHHVVRVRLATGRVLEISPKHPLGDGRTFAGLHAGDRIDGVLVVEAELVPYTHGFTHDILPDSDTGTYVAGGVLIGSTLRGE